MRPEKWRISHTPSHTLINSRNLQWLPEPLNGLSLVQQARLTDGLIKTDDLISIDTLHKEGKIQKVTAKADCSQGTELQKASQATEMQPAGDCESMSIRG